MCALLNYATLFHRAMATAFRIPAVVVLFLIATAIVIAITATSVNATPLASAIVRQITSTNSTDPDATGNATATDGGNGTAGADSSVQEDGAGGGADQFFFPPSKKPEAFNGDCDGLHDVLIRSEGDAVVVWDALFILSYFIGLSSLVFGIVALIRTQVLSARGRPVMVATIVFGVLLAFAGTLAMILRTVLAEVDVTRFGITNKEILRDSDRYCAEQQMDAWTANSGTPYVGLPPRNTWVFWLFTTACFGGAAALALSLVRIRREERVPGSGKVQMQMQNTPTDLA